MWMMMTGKMNRNNQKSGDQTETSDSDVAIEPVNTNPKDDSLDQHQRTVNMSLKLLWKNHLPENRKALEESTINLDKIANYCEGNYVQDDFKDEALVLTKNYCQQALASVTSQIYSYASNIQAALNLLDDQFDVLDAQTKYIGKKLMLNQEKIHRKEIGALTMPKHNTIQPKVIYPSMAKAKTIQNSRYVFEPIDMTVLDHIGVAHKLREQRDSSKIKTANVLENRQMPTVKSATLRPSKSSNLSSIAIAHNPSNNNNNNNNHDGNDGGGGQRSQVMPGHQSNPRSYAMLTANNNGPAVQQLSFPNPSSSNAMFGSLARNHKDYRQFYPLPVMMIPPPQVPSNYVSMKELNNESNSATSTDVSTSSTGTIIQSTSVSATSSLLSVSVKPVQSVRKSSTASSTGTADPQSSKSAAQNDPDPSGQTMLPPPPSPLPCTVGQENQPDQDWIPANYLEKVVAIYDYNADKDDELSFQENSVIYVIRKNDDGWWEGIMNGITGLFPGNYVEHCM